MQFDHPQKGAAVFGKIVEHQHPVRNLPGFRADISRTKMEKDVMPAPDRNRVRAMRDLVEVVGRESGGQRLQHVAVDGHRSAGAAEILGDHHGDEGISEPSAEDEPEVGGRILKTRPIGHFFTVPEWPSSILSPMQEVLMSLIAREIRRRARALGRSAMILLGAFTLFVAASPDATASPPPLRPIPSAGPLPMMVDPALAEEIRSVIRSARLGPQRRALQKIDRRYLGVTHRGETRAAGLRALSSLDAPAALFAMPKVFARGQDDVRAAIIEHLVTSGDMGQAALAWTAIDHPDPRWRSEAAAAIRRPATSHVLAVLQVGFRGSDDGVIESSARLAGALDARLAIPHLIATQYAGERRLRKGDQAWIAIGTQRSYVQNLIPVTGDGSGGFRPVPGIINEGFVMRVTEAFAVIYRTEVHRVLVGMTAGTTPIDTSALGWSLDRWRDWYNAAYLPIAEKHAQESADADLAREFVDRERARPAPASNPTPTGDDEPG